MSDIAKHGKRWSDDEMVGVACFVNTTQGTDYQGRPITRPTDGGVLTGDGEPCASCGARLRLHWDVRIIEVDARATTPEGETAE